MELQIKGLFQPHKWFAKSIAYVAAVNEEGDPSIGTMIFENFICSTKMGCRKGDTVPFNQSEPVEQPGCGSGWLVRTFELYNKMILKPERSINGGRKTEVRINKSELFATAFAKTI